MPLAQITRQGLTAIAIMVALLWSCLITERYLTRHSTIETYRALRQMRYLKFKRHLEPAGAPKSAPATPSLHPVLG